MCTCRTLWIFFWSATSVIECSINRGNSFVYADALDFECSIDPSFCFFDGLTKWGKFSWLCSGYNFNLYQVVVRVMEIDYL